MSEELGKELGWDDSIEKENSGFEPLPEGIYEFTVVSMERGRFPGSEKMAACNKATLNFLVTDEKGRECHVFDDLLLNSKMEWKLSQFFLCIGQKTKGEPLKPRWNEVVGAVGKFRIYINEYTKNDKTWKNNKVSEYLAYEPKAFKAGNF